MSDDQASHPCKCLHNVSLGGLAFKSPRGIPNGKEVRISFPVLDPIHSLTGVVVWNKKSGEAFEIGLEFKDPDGLYRLRMIEQICLIERYREEQQNEGRSLSSEDAAKEWIGLYARDFPAYQE